MILRRVIEHVKAQNWTAIAIDFVIVVAGVFVGLQAQAWSVERDRRKSERDYIARLHDEVQSLMATRASYGLTRTAMAANLVGAVNVLNDGEAGPALSAAQCDSIAGSAHTTVPPAEIPTVTELLSTGRLDQIRSIRVRTAVLNYTQDAARARDLIATITDSGRDLGKVYSRHMTHFLGPSRIGVDSIWVNPVCDTDAMRADHEFRNELSENAYMYNVYAERAVLPVSRRLGELHDVLDAEIGIEHLREGAPAP